MRATMSPTLMDTYRQCPRCAFDEMVLELKRPRGAYPTLPNGIDAIMKQYTDKFRGTLPPELKHMSGYRIHEDTSLINTFRQWNGIIASTDIMVKRPTTANPKREVAQTLVLRGGIDELLINSTDQVVIIDFKTRKDEPSADYGEKYYQHTVDTYAYMLEKNGYDVAPECYLWYWWPKEVDANGKMQFGQKILTMNCSGARTYDRLVTIANALPLRKVEWAAFRDQSPASSDCGYCKFNGEKKDYEDEDKED